MVEKAKKRLTPILLAIMIAALLVISVAGIISFAPLKAEAVTYDKYEFNYTGSVQSKTLAKGTWKFELWGAQGGSGTPYNTSIAGGKGEGMLFRKGKSLYKVPEESLVDALMAEIDKL